MLSNCIHFHEHDIISLLLWLRKTPQHVCMCVTFFMHTHADGHIVGFTAGLKKPRWAEVHADSASFLPTPRRVAWLLYPQMSLRELSIGHLSQRPCLLCSKHLVKTFRCWRDGTVSLSSQTLAGKSQDLSSTLRAHVIECRMRESTL